MLVYRGEATLKCVALQRGEWSNYNCMFFHMFNERIVKYDLSFVAYIDGVHPVRHLNK